MESTYISKRRKKSSSTILVLEYYCCFYKKLLVFRINKINKTENRGLQDLAIQIPEC